MRQVGMKIVKFKFPAIFIGTLITALVLSYQNCGRFGFGNLTEQSSDFFSLGESRIYSLYWLDSLGPDVASVLIARPADFSPNIEGVVWSHGLAGGNCEQVEEFEIEDREAVQEDVQSQEVEWEGLWRVAITCDRPGQLQVTLRVIYESGDEEMESSTVILFENPIDRYNRAESLFVNRCASCHFAPSTNWPIDGKSSAAVGAAIFGVPSMSAQPALRALTPDDIQRISGYLHSLP